MNLPLSFLPDVFYKNQIRAVRRPLNDMGSVLSQPLWEASFHRNERVILLKRIPRLRTEEAPKLLISHKQPDETSCSFPITTGAQLSPEI